MVNEFEFKLETIQLIQTTAIWLRDRPLPVRECPVVELCTVDGLLEVSVSDEGRIKVVQVQEVSIELIAHRLLLEDSSYLERRINWIKDTRDVMEDETGFKPGLKETKDVTDAIRDEMLGRTATWKPEPEDEF